MAIRKREGQEGVTWHIGYLDVSGNQVRESFKKKREAEAELGKRMSLIVPRHHFSLGLMNSIPPM